MDGKPCTPCVSHRSFPDSVQSTSKTPEVAEPSKSVISLSHAGFIDLQCPHQGARNLTNTDFPAVMASQFALVNSVAQALPANNATETSLKDIARARCVSAQCQQLRWQRHSVETARQNCSSRNG